MAMILGIRATSQFTADLVPLFTAKVFRQVEDGLFPVGRFIKWTGTESDNTVATEFDIEKRPKERGRNRNGSV